MKILRATGTILFCFLLLLSLSAFGLAFLTKSTVLNADFIARHVSRLEMTALAYEVIDDYAKAQTTIEVEFLKNALHDFFTEKEPWFKEEVNRAIRALYSFLLGKSERLEIEISLDNLKTGLRDSLWHTMQRYLAENASAIPEELLLPYIDTHYQELLPLIPGPLLPPGMAGLEGQALQAYVHEHYTEVAALLQQAYAQPNVAGLILEQLRPYFNQYYNELAARLPQS
ncbi:MAG: hypothetical protein N2506_06920, partial [Dehalococcoidales bacterium]|nr:hypothetical protein [Dehalococcoidales bacterium]